MQAVMIQWNCGNQYSGNVEQISRLIFNGPTGG
jgi:hypothetical protein